LIECCWGISDDEFQSLQRMLPLAPTTASSDAASTPSLPPSTPSSLSVTPGNTTSIQPISLPAATGVQKSDRQSARTAAIAGSVVGVCLLIGVVFLVLWVRNRRRRRENDVPRQDLAEEINAVHPFSTATAFTSTSPSYRPEIPFRSEKANPLRLVSDSEMESVGETDETMSQRFVRGEAQLAPSVGGTDETMSERLVRVEAQLAAMVRLRDAEETESSPPSYYAGSSAG